MAPNTDESEVGSHAGTLDLTGDLPTATGNHLDSSRRYGGPLIHQHKFMIVSCIVAFGLIILSVGMSASSLQKSNEALELSEATTEAMESVKFISINKNEAETGSGDTTLFDPAVTPNPTPNPTLKPTNAAADQPTESPTEPHPLNPQWFQTTHADYQMAYEAMSVGDGTPSWHIAGNMCHRQNLRLCGYDAYCPNGKGNESFHGGPPKTSNWASLEATQWAPFFGPDEETGTDTGKHWVQIGLVSTSDGGSDENDFAKCYTHDDWYMGGGDDIEDVWEEENRVWILCCEAADEGGA